MPTKLSSRLRAQAFVAELNARTVCAHCGRQPIEWHNPEHVELNRRHYRIGQMAGNGWSIRSIEAELPRCIPLCRRCHMREDGRLQRFIELVPIPAGPGKSCSDCERLAKPLRKGRCGRCDRRRRYYVLTPEGENRGAVLARLWDQKRRTAPRGDLTCDQLDLAANAAESAGAALRWPSARAGGGRD